MPILQRRCPGRSAIHRHFLASGNTTEALVTNEGVAVSEHDRIRDVELLNWLRRSFVQITDHFDRRLQRELSAGEDPHFLLQPKQDNGQDIVILRTQKPLT